MIDLSGPPISHGSSHEANGTDHVYFDLGNWSSSRIDSHPRHVTPASQTIVLGTVYYTYFTAPFNLAITKLFVTTGGTAHTSPTNSYVALHTVDGSGNLAMVFQSADLHAVNDPANGSVAFFSSTLKTWQCPLSLDAAGSALASYTLARGQRYALSALWVGGSAPTIEGTSSLGSLTSLAPQISATRSGQSTIPTSLTAANAAASGLLLIMSVAA